MSFLEAILAAAICAGLIGYVLVVETFGFLATTIIGFVSSPMCVGSARLSGSSSRDRVRRRGLLPVLRLVCGAVTARIAVDRLKARSGAEPVAYSRPRNQ